MLISLNWLKDFVDIPRTITPQELGLRLTMHTVEIDSVKSEADKYKDIVVGRIKNVKKHSSADKLLLAEVDIGKKQLNIVCGAFNIKSGQKVPVALAGAVLPNGVEIKEVEVRGERSEGMLCAEDELGLGEDHSGILILDDKAKIGDNLGKHLNLKDVIYEVDNKSITNRPDLWGHYGMAREIAAFLDVKFKKYNTDPERQVKKIKNQTNIKVFDFKLCPRYMAIVMNGITIEESPKWIKDRLIAVGIRPINNIVDITNYVMLETGQPLHAFDKNLVDKIIVRAAKNGELIKTLDGEDRELDEKDLVIADSKKAIAIAGVMGGENSEINSSTKEIIIESANFNFLSVRRTAQKLGVRTEASQRFEKSLDPNLCEAALSRTVELIKKVCSKSKVASKVADEKKFKLFAGPIELNLDWLNKFTGIKIDEKKVNNILTKLGFGIKPQPNPLSSKKSGRLNRVLLVTTPSWRATKDISIREDLAEEVVRIIGYDNLAPLMPRVEMSAPEANKEIELTRKIKEVLAGSAGVAEVYNYSFVGEEQLNKLRIDYSAHIRLLNPIVEHHTLLRQSLVPNLIENIKKNQSRYNLIKLFEIGSVYLSSEGEIKKSDKQDGNLPYQEKRLGIIIGGNKKDNVFNIIKGVVESLVEVRYLPLDNAVNWAEDGYSADIKTSEINIGSIYKLKFQVAKAIGLKKDIAIAEINFNGIAEAVFKKDQAKFREYEKFPPIIRDLAFVVNEKVLYNDIREEIIKYHEYIKNVDLFDVYQGVKLGSGRKNLAFRVIYQTDKTLTSKEVDELQTGLFKKLEMKFDAKLRDF